MSLDGLYKVGEKDEEFSSSSRIIVSNSFDKDGDGRRRGVVSLEKDEDEEDDDDECEVDMENVGAEEVELVTCIRASVC